MSFPSFITIPYNINWYCGARFWIPPTVRDEEGNEDDNSGVLLLESCEIVLAEAAPNTINQMITRERATVSIRTIYRCETFLLFSSFWNCWIAAQDTQCRQTDRQCKVCIHVVVLSLLTSCSGCSNSSKDCINCVCSPIFSAHLPL